MSYQRALPAPNADSNLGTTPSRTARYNEAYTTAITNKELFAADEGSQYVAVNPTAGTGILSHAAPTTFDETKANLFVYNGGSNRIYLQSLVLIETVVSVGGTRINLNLSTDTGNLLSSGGTTLTKSNVNQDSANASGAIITAGAAVLTAATAARRLLGNYTLRGANIDVVWDHYTLIFGGVANGDSIAATPSTVGSWFVKNVPPVVIGPGQCFKIVLWCASMSTGPTFEYVLNYLER